MNGRCTRRRAQVTRDEARRVVLEGAAVRYIAFIAIAITLLSLTACDPVEEIATIVVEPVDPAAVSDGTYRGVERHFPVTAVVDVTVLSGRIEDVRIVRHFHGPDHGAEPIADRVVEQQTLEVDAISGSSYSSIVILKAIERALREGT